MTPLVCARCAAPALLAARYPHTWHNGSGERVEGLRESVLCASCDTDDPAAAPLLALLAVTPPPPSPCLANAVEVWLTTIRHRVPDPTTLDTEETLWRTGDL
ncbi:hypothetical protein GCM10010313_36880 [Streptomyces violarus]|uniref:Uncharacterized protein n=1 Tax=Streptomyces violarus TaxID=67380 RepID=A0A7W4ZZ26_9ACTN|nr:MULTISPECIES: DUF6300 family protein [Streptomyces]MBB3081162.1 hypothetical protein [Streptomyces violarus]WRU00271.1 DUF6300 family protein [Streptomyces sp. CGMCC 4.1772]GHD12790.1 hypothetical protein GCM10010313_36880 [Streptomyces violarus]